MENKLVFEPTTLTQYQWNKYELLTTYTYYWQVHQAIADYMTRYTWSKNEVLPDDVPSWDRYTVVDEYADKYYWTKYNAEQRLVKTYEKYKGNPVGDWTAHWDRYDAKTIWGANWAVKLKKATISKYEVVYDENEPERTYYSGYFTLPTVFEPAYTVNVYHNTGYPACCYKINFKRSTGSFQLTPGTHGNDAEDYITPYSVNSNYKLTVFRAIPSQSLYYDTNFQLNMFPCDGNGNPDTSDAAYQQCFPWGSPSITTNTSGFKQLADLFDDNYVYYLAKETPNDSTNWVYIITPNSYYDWNQNRIYNVIELYVGNRFLPLMDRKVYPSNNIQFAKVSSDEYSSHTLPNTGTWPATYYYMKPGYYGSQGSTRGTQPSTFLIGDGYRYTSTVNDWGGMITDAVQNKYYKICDKKEKLRVKKGEFIETITKYFIEEELDLSNYNGYHDDGYWYEIDSVDNSSQPFYDTGVRVATITVDAWNLYKSNKWYWLNDTHSSEYNRALPLWEVLCFNVAGYTYDSTATPSDITYTFTNRTKPTTQDIYAIHPQNGYQDRYLFIYKSISSIPFNITEVIRTSELIGTVETTSTYSETDYYFNGASYYYYTLIHQEYRWYKTTTVGIVNSWDSNAYPQNGYDSNYYYVFKEVKNEQTGNHTYGTFIDEVVSSRNDTYPQNGEKNGYWYIYYGTVNTENKYIYQKATTFNIYQSYWYSYVPKNVVVEQVQYRKPNGTYPTTVFWYDTDTFYQEDGFWDDEQIKLSHPINIYGSWLREYGHMGNLTVAGYDRYFRFGNWYCRYAIPQGVNVKTEDADDILTSGTNLYDLKAFRDLLRKVGGFIYVPAFHGGTLGEYEESAIATSAGFQQPYIIMYQTVPLPGGGTQSGYYPFYLDNTSIPYRRCLVPTGQTYRGYGEEKKYSYRGDNDANYINAGYDYRGVEPNENPDYHYQFIENVSSFVPGSYPDGDVAQDGYYYEIISQVEEIMGYHKGAFIENVSSTNPNAYTNNYVDFNNRYYTYSHADATYSRSNLIGYVNSFIESAYPQDSYVINDAWYIYTGSREVIIGETEINASQLMGGVNYTQEINSSEDLQIGTAGAAQVDFTIYAPDAAAATQYLGKDFTYYVKMAHDTDWRQIGVFTLTKAELPDKQTAKIEGFDYIYKFDTVIDEWLNQQHFPMTLGNLFNSLCQYVGCEAYSTEFNNSTFQVQDNFEAVQITGRTILQYITEVSGGFCVAEPDGRIHIKQYSIPPTGNINLGNDSYVKYTHEIYNVPVITSVVVRKDDEDEGVESNV